MKKFALALMGCLFMALPLQAQTYEKLWNEVEEHAKNDLPKSALTTLEKIRKKAVKEGNDAELLKSMLTAFAMHEDIAPDSGQVVLARMEKALKAEKRPLQRAMWQSALGQLFLSYSHSSSDSVRINRGEELLRQSVSDISLLGNAKYKDYLPVLTEGKDSKYYDVDLLHVLTEPLLRDGYVLSRKEKVELLGRMAEFYRSKGNREATLLVRLDSVDRAESTTGRLMQRSDFKCLTEMSEEYRDLSLNVETYIERLSISSSDKNEDVDSIRMALAYEGVKRYGKNERANYLRQYIDRMEQPISRLGIKKNIVYPADTLTITTEMRNAGKATVNIYRTSLTVMDAKDFTSSKADEIIKNSTLVKTFNLKSKQNIAYRWDADTIKTFLSEPGIYLCRLEGEKTGKNVDLLYVTRIRPHNLEVNGGNSRIIAVDSKSGKPMKGSKVDVYRKNNDKYFFEKTFNADKDGNIFLDEDSRSYRYYQLGVGDDQFCPIFYSNSRYYSSWGQETPVQKINIFSDRAIYRPGQKVYFTAVCWNQLNDETAVSPHHELSVRLYDASRKEVSTQKLTTDEFGKAGGEFQLPDGGLTGQYRLSVSNLNTGRMTDKYVRVEEYKRPTFTAELLQPDFAYRLGDSIEVEGKAETYTGVAVKNALVRYTVKRGFFYDADREVATGIVETDENGHFKVPVQLTYDESDTYSWRWYRFYRYAINADVTAESGETRTTNIVLYASKRSSWLEIAAADKQLKESLTPINVRRCSAPGKNLPTRSYYEVRREKDVVLADSFTTGEPLLLEKLSKEPSGNYRLFIYCADLPTDSSTTFLLISEKDTKPFGKEPLTVYSRLSDDQSGTFIMVGSPRSDVTLFYDIIADGKIVESHRHLISDSLLHINLNYKKAYGDDAMAVFSFIRDGVLYMDNSISILKPYPNKKLTLQWSSFRSLLRPGQQEEWRLRVLQADGKPAAASVVACLYDASLDQLAQNNWNFGIGFSRQLSNGRAFSIGSGRVSLSLSGKLSRLKVPDFVFTVWNQDLVGTMERGRRYPTPMLYSLGGVVPLRGTVRESKMLMRGAVVEEAAMASVNTAVEDDAAAETSEPSANAGEVRSNFAETAFFQPELRTDENGEVSIVFTLPESLTTWNFRALAHDTAVNYARMDTAVIARKEFMLQNALPRFIREGDNTDLPATLTNLTEKTIKGTVRCQLIDAQTGTVVKTMSEPFEVEKEKVVNFRYTGTADYPVLVCRMTAEGDGFSDGEELYLPVLPDRERVTRAAAFSMTKAGEMEVKIDTLWGGSERATDKRLVVELSSNPTWYAVGELPIIANYDCMSATSWATRIYALSLAKFIGENNPEIKRATSAPKEEKAIWTELLNKNPELKQTLTTETPWTTELDDEQARAEELALLFDEERYALRMQSAIDHLKDLQNPDGSWSWYKGMKGSLWITTEVSWQLARQQSLTGHKDAAAMLNNAFSFLEQEMSERVAEMKKAKKKKTWYFSDSETNLKYLYIRAILGKKADSDAKYLLATFEKMKKPTMYERAMRAIVLSLYGKKDLAKKNIESLVEHTVEKPGMGRYFDTDRALWCWRSYKMPTQTAAIEALLCVSPEKKDIIESMKLWVMQSKRTQEWTMLRATTDALYVLLLQSGDSQSVQPLSQHDPLYYTLRNGDHILGINAKSQAEAQESVGYFKQTYTDKEALTADNVVLKKSKDGLAWGAVFTQFNVPAADVERSANGLSVSRSLEVLRNGKWEKYAPGMKLQKGERLRQVFTMTADRDYDFVSLKASRAACMEPTEALSGYTWRDGIGFYRAVRDASNEYFFETFRKGTHTFTEECFIDRSGTYTLGIATLQSQYAPEFCGTTAAEKITVE